MRILLSALLLTLLFSCNNNANNQADDDSTRIRELPADSNEVSIEELDEEDFYVWKVDNDGKSMRKNPKLADATLGVDTLIIGLNEMYPNIKLEKVKLSRDTLYTQINESEYLTERMGSAGSEAYIAQAVLNLTSAPGVKFVRIDFEMGSHAMPDTWSKENFKDYKPVQ